MDDNRFDDLARSWAADLGRRGLLKRLGAGVLAGLLALGVVEDDAEARPKRKQGRKAKKGRRKDQPKRKQPRRKKPPTNGPKDPPYDGPKSPPPPPPKSPPPPPQSPPLPPKCREKDELCDGDYDCCYGLVCRKSGYDDQKRCVKAPKSPPPPPPPPPTCAPSGAPVCNCNDLSTLSNCCSQGCLCAPGTCL